ncbi:MAG: cation:proton antiporter [Sandaracinaceae bacterium]|nr:cation:proton antiporter [Sandaracinaceae bacterium]
MHGQSLVADLAVVLGVAAVTSVIARRLHQPSILGYLVAGLLVGPYVPIPLMANQGRVEALAEFGVVLVMFAVGLEFRIAKLMRVLPTSGLTGLLQVSFMMWAGVSLGQVLGWRSVESIFLGACLAISSTMVVSKVLEERPVQPDARELIFGVLVFQDVVAIILIAVLTAIAAGGGLEASELLSTVGKLAGFLVAMMVGGLLLVPRVVRMVARLKSLEILVVFSVGLCFAMAETAAAIGYSVALGAFIAGILVAESGKGEKVEHLIQPLRDVFAAIFFVSIGMTVDPMQAVKHLPVSLGVFALVVTGQLLIVSVAGVISGNSLRRSIIAGLALGQIGEFAFILAGIGIGARVVRASLSPVLVTVAVLTAFTTPLFLRGADKLVSFVDKAMPHRLERLLSLYEDWLVRLRSEGEAAADAPSIMRSLRIIVFDAVALIAIAALGLEALPKIVPIVSKYVTRRTELVPLALNVAVLVVAAPLVWNLVRTTRLLATLVSHSVVGDNTEQDSGRVVVARTLRPIVQLVVLLAVGFPAAAVLRPLRGGTYVLLGVMTLFVGGLFVLWRRAGAVETELQSSAARIAGLLASSPADTTQSPATSSVDTLADSSLLPGLDVVRRVRLAQGAFALGQTLTALNLRALTGASVVAIHRAGGDVVLPTGRERLEEGDTLALAGPPGSLDDGQHLLVSGPSPVERVSSVTSSEG